MPKRGGRRVQIKRTKFQIKEALLSSQDPLPFLIKLHNLENNLNESKSNTKEDTKYKITPIEVEHKYYNYKSIERIDPRHKHYKVLELFGPEKLVKQPHESNSS